MLLFFHYICCRSWFFKRIRIQKLLKIIQFLCLNFQPYIRDVIWQRKVAIGNESLPSSLPSLIAKSRWVRGKVTFQGKIFSFLIKLLWIISILYLYYCCTIYKLLFGIKGTRISHVFHDFCWLHLNFPIIMEHEPFTSSLPLFDKNGQWMPLFVA